MFLALCVENRVCSLDNSGVFECLVFFVLRSMADGVGWILANKIPWVVISLLICMCGVKSVCWGVFVFLTRGNEVPEMPDLTAQPTLV